MKHTILRSVIWVVILNTLVVLTHSVAHFALQIFPTTIFDDLFIGIVIIIAPLVALFMILTTRLSGWGRGLLLLSMLGSLIYGLAYHFLLPGMDNVATPGPDPWHLVFVFTSYLQLPLQAAGSMIGIWALFSKSPMQMQAPGKGH